MNEPNPAGWKPLSEQALFSLIECAEIVLDEGVLEFWKRIRIRPKKWSLSPIGDLGGGFWVVAVIGQKCVWFNDIEDGFNISEFDEFGIIRDYECNQTELSHLVLWLWSDFRTSLSKARGSIST